ncbi:MULTISPECIES: DUF2945 domain-containing protein [Ramlibacter]|uniref:DUF2945 domain-containing protein n=1 Tax=Ramlibacter aquaticus TaxID=2780094 RepID=A0ABR9SDY8_9BURK|nr:MULTISPECIES: DUF2945 domain-containing protein [Ramlibacter]MBE7940566.1 DUF2945 domain-containing protein [Ramlibacter aquaticus]
MSDKFKPGDEVEWNSHGGTARGKVIRKLESPIRIKNHEVAASPENPEYLVESRRGGRAAHKEEALRRPSERSGERG